MARKSFPVNQGNCYHIKEETFSCYARKFSLFSHFQRKSLSIYTYTSKKKVYFTVTVQIAGRKQKIRSVLFCALSFNHLLDKSMNNQFRQKHFLRPSWRKLKNYLKALCRDWLLTVISNTVLHLYRFGVLS